MGKQLKNKSQKEKQSENEQPQKTEHIKEGSENDGPNPPPDEDVP